MTVPSRPRRGAAAVALGSAALAVAGLAACGSEPAGTRLAVTGTDTTCEVARNQVTAGVTELEFANKGSAENEVYVLRPDGSVVGERENVGPGTTANLVVELRPGSYQVQCKPGMKGDGIRSALTVTAGTAASASASADPRLAAAVDGYRRWVTEQATSSRDGAVALAAAVKAGDVAKARSLYAASRVGWERTEPVAESFGDLDPKVDLREADLESGQKWTGWHVLEKGLFATGSANGLGPVADQLVADLNELLARIPKAEITPTSMASGASELLDEVSATKVTGEEEIFSHTDLVDFQANVDGARQVITLLRPVLAERDAALLADVEKRFTELAALLTAHRTGPGDADFASYTTVTDAQRKALSAAVDTVSEPLSRVAAAVAR